MIWQTNKKNKSMRQHRDDPNTSKYEKKHGLIVTHETDTIYIYNVAN